MKSSGKHDMLLALMQIISTRKEIEVEYLKRIEKLGDQVNKFLGTYG
jgi:hypothetical protein